MRRISYVVASGLTAALLFASSPALGQSALGPKVQDVLEASQGGEGIAVIVMLADQVDTAPFKGVANAKGHGRGLARAALVQALKGKAAATQQPVQQLLEDNGIEGAVSLWAVNGVAVKAPPGIVRALAALPGVASVELDATLDAPKTEASTASVPEWNLDTIRAPELWALGHSGAGIVVAGMDTGVDANHPDLASRWRGGSGGWFDPNGEHASPHDSDGHGTQTLGLVVGGDAGGSAIGVAPDAQWIAVKIFNDAGQASLSVIHQGFQWLLDPDGNPGTDDAPDVVNNSWNFQETLDQCYTEFEPDIELLETAGIAVVFSAGNRGPGADTSLSPANNFGSLATGAVDAALGVASASSRGPGACDGGIYPHLVAPGVNVRTTDLTFGGTFPDSYVSATGTSFAAPHVSGAMALLLGAFPATSAGEVRQALEASALDLGLSGPDSDHGHGLVDLVEAFAALDGGPPPPSCDDADGDGYFTGPDCTTPLDCDDADAGINPGACDIKRDGIDQNCDGADRRGGKGCPDPGGTGGTGGTAGSGGTGGTGGTAGSGGIGGTGGTAGSGGTGGTAGSGGTGGTGGTVGSEGKGKTCRDGVDNDGDGKIDCGDPDCSKNKQCR